MKRLRHCLACDFVMWKFNISNSIWEIKRLNYKPTVGIEKTKKFSVLSLI